MNVFVSGGAGYIGSELVNKLAQIKEIDKVIVYDNLARKNYNFFTSYAFDKSKITFIEGDLLDSRKLRSALKDVDVVYHLAALTDKNPRIDSHIFEQVNHWGTSELMNVIEESSVQKVIYLSTTAIYGSGEFIFSEANSPNPETFYATSKWRGEEQVKRLFNTKKCYIVRVGNVYGYSPCLRIDGVINKFMFDANFKNKISILGNGRQYRNYIHIDVVSQTLSKFLTINPDSDTFNLIDKNLQVLDVVEILQELYPRLEFIFINQHLKIKNIQISTSDVKLSQYIHIEGTNLIDDLSDYKSNFSF